MHKTSTRDSGNAGENAALRFLLQKGYKILQRNFRSKVGEIDIIATEGGALVFVEVKTRWNRNYGYPEEAVTPYKLRSIIKTAEYFKLLNPNTPGLLRIDVVALEVEGNQVLEIRLHKNVSQ